MPEADATQLLPAGAAWNGAAGALAYLGLGLGSRACEKSHAIAGACLGGAAGRPGAAAATR
jgi:hypothetical protein